MYILYIHLYMLYTKSNQHAMYAWKQRTQFYSNAYINLYTHMYFCILYFISCSHSYVFVWVCVVYKYCVLLTVCAHNFLVYFSYSIIFECIHTNMVLRTFAFYLRWCVLYALCNRCARVFLFTGNIILSLYLFTSFSLLCLFVRSTHVVNISYIFQ